LFKRKERSITVKQAAPQEKKRLDAQREASKVNYE
jgi:hypothetical protein